MSPLRGSLRRNPCIPEGYAEVARNLHSTTNPQVSQSDSSDNHDFDKDRYEISFADVVADPRLEPEDVSRITDRWRSIKARMSCSDLAGRARGSIPQLQQRRPPGYRFNSPEMCRNTKRTNDQVISGLKSEKGDEWR